MGGECKSSLTLPRRSMLAGAIATLILSKTHPAEATNFLTFRICSPALNERFKNWWNQAEHFGRDLMGSTNARVVQFRSHIDGVPRNRGLIEFFRGISSLVNSAAPYTEDLKSRHGNDQWATPIEFLKNGGDCEDFALTKAATLYSLGWPLDSTYLLIGVLDKLPKNIARHAVLVVMPDKRRKVHLVLDSMTDLILDIRDYHAFRPIYRINRQGVSMFVPARH